MLASRVARLSLGSGLALGVLALLTDSMTGAPQAILLALSDKGFLWASAALLVGSSATTVRSAMVMGTVCLALATLTYYGLILAATDRWRRGTMMDGSSALVHGLMSVGRASAFWLVASVVVGSVLGYAGFGVRRFPSRRAVLLAGAAAGCLASGGVYSLITWNFTARPHWWLQPIIFALTAAVPVAAAFAVAHHRRSDRVVLLASFAAASMACVSLWAMATAIRTSAF